MLAVFLEKDNLKLLVFKGKTRQFAGQISFSPEVVRDAFIADPSKFSSQIKMAFAQKPPLKEEKDVVLFVSPDKTFSKTMDGADALDGFIQSLPYFKEELVLSSYPIGKTGKVTHVAFEKKLVEDLQRPFLESGKTVVAVRSSVNDLVLGYPQLGDYFLFMPFEKEIGFAAVAGGGILEMGIFKPDIFLMRFGEFVANHALSDVRMGYTVGVFPKDLAEKLHHAQNLTISAINTSDIYDSAVTAFSKMAKTGLLAIIPAINLPKIPVSQKQVMLAGAILAGILLVVGVAKSFTGSPGKKNEVVTPVANVTPTPLPEAKAADYSVRVLNGTRVEGEAGRVAVVLKELGFVVDETKNATSAGFTTTKLRIVSGVPETIVTMVKTSLEVTYETVAVETLEDEKVKIEVIIGKKK